MARLHRKRCLIVGGTGGIGGAVAERFCQEEALVHAVGLPEVDATVPAQVEAMFDRVREKLGGLDVLCHIAGASGRKQGDGRLHECSDDGWRWTLDVNLTSMFLTNRSAVRHFLAVGQPGCILNMASMLALAPSPRHFDAVAYTASKSGVIGMSRLLASSYAADGIRVNVLAPALVETPMAGRAVSDPVIGSYLKTKQPLAEGPLSAASVAQAVVFLCSDEARFVTGVVLPVDGGWAVSEGQFR
jgi:NAD(P)-dependent dehydrogenase (short-subunit alcohol dehydrogenase family)